MTADSKKPKVIVCGAGIGGLTAAHELSKRNFDVTIYERQTAVGGLARSKYHTESHKKYPVEYSWRIYGSGYRNLLRLMGEIPLRTKKTKSVLDNLVRVCTYIFCRFDKEELMVSRYKDRNKLVNNFKLSERLAMLNIIFYCLTMSKKRMDSLDHVKWKDYCDYLPPEVKKYMVQLWGPVLGMDMTHASFPVVSRIMGVLLGGYVGSASCLFLMNKPTNDGWFDEWTDYLQHANGVKIKTNCEIMDFKLKDGKISSILIKDHHKNLVIEDRADYYVCGMSIDGIAKIVSKNPELSKIPSLKNTVKLAEKSKQIQLSVQIFLDKKIIYPADEKIVLYLPDTPWSLIIEPEDLAWGNTFCTDKNVKAVLSVGICQTDKPGIVFNKPFTRCAPSEIKEEVWSQIIKSYKMSGIVTENGEKIDRAKILLFYIWDSFKFNNQKKEIEAGEPKFSNNINSLKYQPNHSTEIPNFLFAAGYTKTDRFIYSMESAAEAGTLCANEIIKKQDNSAPLTKVYPFRTSSIILKPLIALDQVLYQLRLPHLSKLTLNNSIFLVFLYAIALSLPLVFFIAFLMS